MSGIGVAKDESKAVELYRKAAEGGSEAAQYKLGLCYRFGKGVARDESKAMEWYRKAADQGHEDAKKELRLLESMQRVRNAWKK